MTKVKFYQEHGYYGDMEDSLRAIAKGKEDSRAMRAANQIQHLKEKIAMLEQGLSIIAGHDPCCDNLMSNQEIAEEALRLVEE